MNREKKQMVVMGVLALMIVCVGAFQMMGGSPPPAPAAKKEKPVAEKTSTSETKPKVANPDQARPLPKRDPFAPSEFALSANEDPLVAKQTAQESGPKTTPGASTGSGNPGPLPNMSGTDWPEGGKIDGGGNVPLLPPPPKFSYALIGLVAGTYPAAVFTDASGNQKLVEVGDSIDASSTLVAVTGNKVKVKFHDQTLVLTVGGNPHGK